MNPVLLLKKLRSDYANRKLSALVGAGFSRNALPAFPLWTDLLLPLVLETYAQEFEELRRYYIRRAKKNEESRSESLKYACRDILLKYGNLEVVSEYIRRNAIGHEAIDAYIEQFIKPATRSGNGWIYNGKHYNANLLQTHMDLLQCSYFRHIYTTNYDNLLEIAQELNPSGETIRVVTDEVGLSDLAIQRAIIKLHGDIRQRAEDEYGFDGDRNLKYIIAKEDYDSYMQKHQGFSYLMRLAMLQGRFCLFGFSGSDPNYMMWLQWMKEILDKEPRKGFKADEESDVKVYMIQPFANPVSEAADLYYRNHHVGVINLTDDAVIREMQQTLNEAAFHPSTKNKSAVLLQLLFRYLRSAQKEITTSNDPLVSDEYSDKYMKLWRNLDSALVEKRDLSETLTEIDKAYDAAKIPANVSWQEGIIHHIIRIQEPWDKHICRAFALAVRDKGNMPEYYRLVIPQDAPLLRDSIWKKLRQTESVMLAPAKAQDAGLIGLLRIMAHAYSLDFDGMATELTYWRPASNDMPMKWMLLSLLNRRDKYVNRLDENILKTQDELDKMNLCVMRNLQSREWPQRYNIRAYAKRGLKSTIDIMQAVSQHRNEQQEKNKKMPYGVLSHSVTWARGNRRYEDAMRIISLLRDNAYVPSYYHTSLLPEEDWYDVFLLVYEKYPFPLIYYSSFLTNENLLRRMGQDMAFSERLYPLLPELLKRMLLVFRQKHHPTIVEKGLLIMSAELYAAVSEDYWYPLFRENVLPIYCSEILPGDYVREYWTPNVRAAVACLKSSEHVNDLFTLLMAHFDTNPDAISSICTANFDLSSMSEDNASVRQCIAELLAKGSLKQCSEMYYILTFYHKLTEEQRRTIAEMLEVQDLSFSKDNKNTLIYLAHLALTPSQITIIKDPILEIGDIFNCGIDEDHRGEPAPFYINDLPDTFVWTHDELGIIRADMMRNLEKMRIVKLREDDFFVSSYLNLLVLMIRFSIAHRNDMPDLQELERLIWKVITHLTGAATLPELFYSKDYFTLDVAYNLLVTGLARQLTQTERTCVDIIITRVMMKDSDEYQTLVSLLSGLLTDFPQFMFENYKEALIGVLREGRNIDYQVLNINLAAAYASLIHIAEVLHKHGARSEIIREWLTDLNLRRFANRLK